MATAKEIVENAIKNGVVFPDSVVSDLNSQAITDEMAAKLFGEKYGGMPFAENADEIEDPTIPDVGSVASALGLQDDPKDVKNPRTKEQKFVEDFPKKISKWKKKIVDNKTYGKLGWETVKKIWRTAALDKMDADILKSRKEELSGAIPMVAEILAPRTMERIENTGDWKAKDMLADIAENAAMTIPGGAFTGIAGKGIAKFAPKVVRYFAAPGENIAEGVLKGAGRMAGNIFGNAVVPFASEGMDAAIYGDGDDGLEDRADFSTGDAAIGTAINQGVNRGIMRMAGPMLDRFTNGGLARGGMMKARDFLENLGLPFSKRGDDFADAARLGVDAPIRRAGDVLEGDIKKAEKGASAEAGVQTEKARREIAEKEIVDAIDRGEIRLVPKSQWTAKSADTEAGDFIEKEMAKRANGYTRYDVDDIFDVSDYLAKDPGNRLSEETLRGAIRSKFPEAYNYAIWHGSQKPSASARILNAINQGVPAWVVNKYGSESDADLLLANMPKVKAELNKERDEAHSAPKKRKASRDVLSIASNVEDLDDRDRKYIKAIAENPDIMTFGYPEDRDDFNIWLLQRGNKLLRGTSAYRPTFSVE